MLRNALLVAVASLFYPTPAPEAEADRLAALEAPFDPSPGIMGTPLVNEADSRTAHRFSAAGGLRG